MLVLALDTSTPTVTAGVVSLRRPDELLQSCGPVGDGRPAPSPITVLAEHTVTDPYAHAERLIPLAQAALADCEHRLPDLDAIVVGLGPGPFTGLRVGIATAAALGDALDIPVHGVPSHDALARCAGPLTGDLLVVTDARRREVYLSAYRRDLRRLFGPLVVGPGAVPDLLAEHGMTPAQLAGPGAPLLDGMITLVPEPTVAGPATSERATSERATSEPATSERATSERATSEPATVESAVTGTVDQLSGGLVERAGLALLTGAVPGPLTPLYLRRPDATEPGARRSVLGR